MIRRNLTQHRQALKNPTTRALLKKLQEQWPDPNFSDVARGDAIRELIGRGCTRRGLAKRDQNVPPGPDELDCSEGSVRRYIAISELGQLHRTAIEAGEMSGDKILRNTRDQRRKEQYLQKLAADETSEKEVQDLMKLVKHALDDARIHFPTVREQIVCEVEKRTHFWPVFAKHFPASCSPVPPPAPAGKDRIIVLHECRPPMKDAYGEELFLIEAVIEQLVMCLLKIAPTPAARNEALRRLRHEYEGSTTIIDTSTCTCPAATPLA